MPPMLPFVLAMVFAALGIPAAQAAPCAGFDDVDAADAFCPNVEWIRNRGITLGCTATLYCPTGAVSRLAMAAFLNRLEPQLPPQFIAANGAVLGPYVNVDVASNPNRALLRVEGDLYPIKMDTTDFVEWNIAHLGPYFTTGNCSGTPFVITVLGKPGLPFSSAYYEVGTDAGGGSILLVASGTPVPRSLLSTQAPGGACVSLAGIVHPTVGARIAVAIDLPTPFKLR